MRTAKSLGILAAALLSSLSTACTHGEVAACHETGPGKRLSYAGHEIYYEARGAGPRTLVFIHGWTGNLQAWKHQLDAFPQYRVLAIDLPGNGQSSRQEGAAYTMEFFADAVHAVLTAEGIDRAFFFGHSMGFAVVEVIATKHPELCAGIAAIDGLHFEVPADTAGQAQWRQGTEAMAAAMTTEQARTDFIDMLLRPDTPALLREEILRASRTVPLSIGRAMIAGAAADAKYWLPKKLEVPCLAVYSPAYQLPPTYRDDFARTFTKVEYHSVQNVSHFFMLEIPYQVNQLIADFVARH